MVIFVNLAGDTLVHLTNLNSLIFDGVRDIHDIGLECTNFFHLGNNDDGVQFIVSALPLVEQTDFLVEV